MDDPTVLFPLAGLLLGLLCFCGVFRSGRRWRLIDILPTSKTTGVFIGLVELEGHRRVRPAAGELPCRSPCVWYQLEHRGALVSRRHRDVHRRATAIRRPEPTPKAAGQPWPMAAS